MAIAAQETVLMGADAINMARLQDANAVLITQALIATVTGKIVNLEDETEAALTVTEAANIFDTPVSTAPWTVDSTGYNFRHRLPASVLSAKTRYQVEYKFTDTAGEISLLIFIIDTAKTFS